MGRVWGPAWGGLLVILWALGSNRPLLSSFLTATGAGPCSPQLCASCWAAWSSRMAGTLRRSETCAGPRPGSTPWETVRCVGRTSWPLSASSTPSSSPFWPSFWATDKRTCCRRSSSKRTKASTRFWVGGYVGGVEARPASRGRGDVKVHSEAKAGNGIEDGTITFKTIWHFPSDLNICAPVTQQTHLWV